MYLDIKNAKVCDEIKITIKIEEHNDCKWPYNWSYAEIQKLITELNDFLDTPECDGVISTSTFDGRRIIATKHICERFINKFDNIRTL